MGNPEVDRWRPVVQGERQFREDGVAQVNPAARENEPAITWRFAGRRLPRECPELAGILW